MDIRKLWEAVDGSLFSSSIHFPTLISDGVVLDEPFKTTLLLYIHLYMSCIRAQSFEI